MSPILSVGATTYEEVLHIRITDLEFEHFQYPNETYFVFSSMVEVWNNGQTTLDDGLRDGCKNELNVKLKNEISEDHLIHFDVARLMGYCSTDNIEFPLVLDPGEKGTIYAQTGILIYENVSQIPVNTYRFETRFDLRFNHINYGANLTVGVDTIETEYDSTATWSNELEDTSTPSTLDLFSSFLLVVVVLPILKSHKRLNNNYS